MSLDALGLLFVDGLGNASDGAILTAHDGSIVYLNSAAEKLLGMDQGCPYKAFRDLFRPDNAALHEAAHARALRGEQLIYEWSYENQSVVRNLQTSLSPITGSDGIAQGVVGILRDITNLKRAEAERDRFFNLSADLLCVMSLDGYFERLNLAWERVLGFSNEQLLSRPFLNLVHPEDRPATVAELQRLARGASAVSLENRFVAQDGTHRWLSWSCAASPGESRVFCVARDITIAKHEEVEHRQAQKLEAVGRLAAGIAHEINTPVQFIGDSAHFLREAYASLSVLLDEYKSLCASVQGGRPLADCVALVHEAEANADLGYLKDQIPKAIDRTLEGVSRVASIVRAMKDFARPNVRDKQPTDLNQALLSTLTVARNEIEHVAEVETNLAELPPVSCHAGDINQVLLNLLVNAAHAIEEVVRDTDKKGKILIRTAHDGDEVVVSISDTGCGIPEQVRPRVFDPFFTTKEVGRGSGQGLTVARSIIVDRHKGVLTFESAVGVGTCFYIRLPLAEKESTAKEDRPNE